jgi:hypothetical protein
MRYVAGSIIVIVVEMNDILASGSVDKVVSLQPDRASQGIVIILDACVSYSPHKRRYFRAVIVNEPLEIWPVLAFEAGVNQRQEFLPPVSGRDDTYQRLSRVERSHDNSTSTTSLYPLLILSLR